MGVWVQERMGVTVPGAAAATGTHRLGHAAGTEPLLPGVPQAIDVLVGEFPTLAAVRMLVAWVPMRVMMEMMIGERIAHVH